MNTSYPPPISAPIDAVASTPVSRTRRFGFSAYLLTFKVYAVAVVLIGEAVGMSRANVERLWLVGLVVIFGLWAYRGLANTRPVRWVGRR